jgi:hypothetical protein
VSSQRVSIDVHLDGIAHVLRDKRLAVPPFQRSYSWRTPEVETFWLDLRSAQLKPEPEYFLGTIVLTPGGDGRMTIIDGQQRLATTTLLLAAIRDAFSDAGDGERAKVLQNDYIAPRSLRSSELEPKLVLNEDDDDFYIEAVVQRAGVAPSQTSHERLLAAYVFLRKAVQDDVDSAKDHWDELLYKWTNFLDNSAQVIVVTSDSEADSFLIFETLNDRGLALTVADLLKNYLFSLARDEIKTVQRYWSAALSALDVAPEETFTTFLRHYWSSLHGATRERELYREIRRFIRSKAAAVEFAERLEEAGAHYAALLDPGDEIWARVGVGASEAVAALSQLGLEQNRPLLLAAMDHFEESELRRLLRALLAWSVRGVIVGGIGGGTTERYYSDAATQIRAGKVRDTEGVISVLSPIVPADDVFRSAFARASVPRSQVARYLLTALERKAKGRRHPSLLTATDRRGYTVEPVVPPSASPEEWPAFGEDAAMWAKRLGNLALLRRDGPRLIRKNWADRKALVWLSKAEINAPITAAKEWTPEAVRERQEQFAVLAVEIWPLTVGD